MASETSNTPEISLLKYSRTSLHIADTSLIICSRNRPDMLHASIASVLEGQKVPAEIVVIDQSDAPDVELSGFATEAAERFQYIWSATRGLSRGNNLGISLAQYQWLVFTHDDVFVACNWFENLAGALMAAGERTVVTGRVLATAPEVEGGFATTLQTGEEVVMYEGRAPLNVLKPFNMAMHRSALEIAGQFDEDLGPGTPFPGAEDSDLGFRLLEAGYKISYVPAAVLYHRAWRRSRDYLPVRWNYGVAQGAFYAKHLSCKDRHMAVRFIADVRRRVRRFPRRLLSEPLRSLGDPLYVAGNLFGAMRWTAMHWRRSKG